MTTGTGFTRRHALTAGMLAAVAAFFPRGGMSAQSLTPARDAVDHLILGCADLEKGIAWLEQRTGARAAIGGSHPGRGTHNALLGLGGRQYLEIIAQDPAQPSDLRPDLGSHSEPRLIGWASAAADLVAAIRNSRTSGAKISDPRDGARARPDGRVVRWRTAAVEESFDLAGISPVPFFIEWGADAVHPSQDSPAGGRLQSLVFEHPEAAALQALLKQLGIDASVTQSAGAALVAQLATPGGTVLLR